MDLTTFKDLYLLIETDTGFRWFRWNLVLLVYDLCLIEWIIYIRMSNIITLIILTNTPTFWSHPSHTRIIYIRYIATNVSSSNIFPWGGVGWVFMYHFPAILFRNIAIVYGVDSRVSLWPVFQICLLHISSQSLTTYSKNIYLVII